MSNNKILYVYVIYDISVTSIRGIYQTHKKAKYGLLHLKHKEFCYVMKIPFCKSFNMIDEFKMGINPDYLSC